MRLDKLTVKAQEAVQAAQSLADQHDHQAIEPEHLLLALLQQQEGVVGPLLAKLGARPEAVSAQVQAEIDEAPEGAGRRAHVRVASLRGRDQSRVGRGAAAEGRVRLDRAPAHRHRPGKDRRRHPHPRRQRRDPRGHLPVARRGARHPAGDRPEPRGEVPGAPALLEGPDGPRAQGQARSGHRPRRGDPPRDPGALPPHQEQSRADRRARRRQDRHRRGPGPAHRGRGHARGAARQAPGRPRHRRHAGRDRSTAASSRTA